MVEAVTLVLDSESLTGDHRRDVRVNLLLRTCQVRDVGEGVAREAARLRHAAHRSTGRDISAVDALVVAHASGLDAPTVATGDVDGFTALATHCQRRVQISSVR